MFILVLVLANLCFAQRGKPGLGPSGDNICTKGEKGVKGAAGIQGRIGASGVPGRPGKPGYSIYLPPENASCTCNPGSPGNQGPIGHPGQIGAEGDDGVSGSKGERAEKGDEGEPGLPGPPASTLPLHPPTKIGKLYVPLVIKGRMPQVICHHFRRKAYGMSE